MAVSLSEVIDLDGVALWHEVEATSVRVDQPGLVADPLEEDVARFADEGRVERTVLYLVHDGGDVVGNAMLLYPQLDNLDNAFLHLTVVPDCRGRGIGRAAAERLLEIARASGRARVMGFVASPLDRDGPGLVLAASLGATRANENLRRELDLEHLDPARLDELERDLVGDHASGYELVTWIDRAPDALVDSAAILLSRMSTDAPQGDSAWAPESWDAARYRELEASAAARGRRRLVGGAVDPASGALVAYSDIGVSINQPEIAYQWDTVVDPAHRGHRLGLAIKIANLRQLRTAFPRSRCVQTWNAASNTFMVAVNDAIGFHPVQHTTLVQLEL